MHDKTQRRPVIDPILHALKSRRVLVALITLIVGAVTLAVPDLHPVQGELLTLLITLALAVIGGYTVEDAAREARGRDKSLDDADLKRVVREVFDGLLDELNLK